MLYVVAMPIGDIADLSPRALAVLAQVDLIACEDTRRVAPLLAAHSIRTPTLSYFEHNEERRAPELVERMRRAMTCVYWDPKSRMTICSVMA